MDIFPIYYFPPISWFAAFLHSEHSCLEGGLHFRKQNYYNRMHIKGPNKVQILTVPVVRDGEQTPLLERRVSYDEPWQNIHWKSLETAYRATPFFEFYEDKLQPFFEDRHDRLANLNLHILEVLIDLLGLEKSWSLSEKYKASEHYEQDFRHAFAPRGGKHPAAFQAEPYRQLFGDFAEDLSILDLLFNMGPESRGILMKAWN